MNMRLMIVVVLSVFMSQVAWGQNGIQTPDAVVRAKVGEQPSEIPGDWEMREMPWPDLKEIVEKAQPNPYLCGLYTWAGEYKDNRESIKQVGWKAFRIAGPFDDEIVRMVVEDGVSVMWTLGIHVTGEPKRRPDYESDEAFIAGYLEGVSGFLNRYGPKGSFFEQNKDLPHRPIVYVEIWNEPNFQYMIPDDDRPRAEWEADREALYAKLLPAVYAHIKKNWPDVTVVGWGAGGASHGDLRFIQHVHEASEKVADSYDILSTHPYVHPVPPEVHKNKSWGGHSVTKGLAEIREVLTKHGRGDVPIWYTEVGWPISKADGGHFATPAKGEFATPMLQAAYVCRQYAQALRLGVERVNIMFVTDSDGFNGGFFLRDKSWRPSAHAVQNMINLMPAPKLVGVDVEGVDGVYVYRINPGSAGDWNVVMAWKVDGPGTHKLQCKGVRARVIDMLGNVKVLKAKDGIVNLDIGPLPVYVIVE